MKRIVPVGRVSELCFEQFNGLRRQRQISQLRWQRDTFCRGILPGVYTLNRSEVRKKADSFSLFSIYGELIIGR